MDTKADILMHSFKDASNRSSSEFGPLIHNKEEELFNKKSVSQLKYLADAGVPEAMLAYAKLCFNELYLPVNKPYAFKLVIKLLNNLSTQNALAWIQSNLDDGFIARVIEYQYENQYGTAFIHKLWVWANQVRLNFSRIAVISKIEGAKQGPLDQVALHPIYASLAFVMFTARLFVDAGVLIHTARRDKKARAIQGNFEWFKQFIKKDDKWLRYVNDIVWAGLGVAGFTLFMMGIEGLQPSLPLVCGYFFDVVVEIFKGVRQYKALSQEVAYLGERIDECDSMIAALQGDPANAEEINELEERAILYHDRLNAVIKERTKKLIRSILLVTGNFLLFGGMFIGKLIPLMTVINPMIGFGIVLGASGLIFLHKAFEAIRDYREQKLKEKIDVAIDKNDQLMAKAFEDKTRDPNNELIVKLSEKSFFSKRRNARGKYVKIDPDAQDGIQLRTMKLR